MVKVYCPDLSRKMSPGKLLPLTLQFSSAMAVLLRILPSAPSSVTWSLVLVILSQIGAWIVPCMNGQLAVKHAARG